MLAREGSILVPRTSRYYLLGEPSEKVERVWLSCHGYGQLGKYFIKKFEPIAGPEDLIIAPEGMSRFYLDGNAGRVGASWMTQEDRLSEIRDQHTQLDNVLEEQLSQLSHRPKLIAFGFSQGTATVLRWAVRTDHQIDAVVCWAGTVPPDLDEEQARIKFNGKPAVIALGNEDPYLASVDITKNSALLQATGLIASTVHFTGGHTIPFEALIKVNGMLQGSPSGV